MKNNNIKSNSLQPQGEYVCISCGTHLELDNVTTMPPCPTCGKTVFKKQN